MLGQQDFFLNAATPKELSEQDLFSIGSSSPSVQTNLPVKYLMQGTIFGMHPIFFSCQ
jgi:hypothetical protein